MIFNNNRCPYNEYQEPMNENVNPYEQNMVGATSTMPGCVCPVVYECPKENLVHRTIMHEVPHVQTINTKVINHHVYRHTYTPCYTMSEMNTCENVYDGCSGNNF